MDKNPYYNLNDIVKVYCKNNKLYLKESQKINGDAIIYTINNYHVGFTGLELRQYDKNLLEHVHRKLDGMPKRVV